MAETEPKNGTVSRISGLKVLIGILATLATMMTMLFFTMTLSQHASIEGRLGSVDAKLTTLATSDASSTAELAAIRGRVETLERGRDENRHSIEDLQREISRMGAGLPPRR